MTRPAPGSGGPRRVVPSGTDGARRADPLGKRALFGPPPGLPDAPPLETVVPDPARAIDPFSPAPRRRPALFSVVADPRPENPGLTDPGSPSPNGSRRLTAATVTCRACGARTDLAVLRLAMRLLTSVWVPGRHFSRYLRCPACAQRSWCRVSWGGVSDGRVSDGRVSDGRVSEGR